MAIDVDLNVQVRVESLDEHEVPETEARRWPPRKTLIVHLA